MSCVLLAGLWVSALVGVACSSVSSAMTSYDTIVVGLGAAGTTAASTLAHAGKRVLALEAQDRVGGRVWTRPFGDGVVEAGAEWIHGQFPSRVYELAVQNNVTVLFQDDVPTLVHQSDGSDRTELLAELLWYSFELMKQGSDENEPLGDFIEKRIKKYLQKNKEKYHELLEDNNKWESLLSLLEVSVNTYKSSSSWRNVTALSHFHFLDGKQYGNWNRYGYKTFFEILLNKYNNGPGLPSLDIKLNKEVTSIQWPQQSGGEVVVTCKDGAQYSAANVIVTVSLGVLKEKYQTLFSPPLPQEKITAIDVVSFGVMDKIILLFDKPWPVPERIMFYWTAEDKEKLPDEDKWITKLLGTSVPAGANNAVSVFLNGDNAKFVETLPEEVVKTKIVEVLQRFVGPNVTVPHLVDMIRTTWFSNPFTRGSYSYDSLETAKHPDVRDTLAAPLLDAGGAPRVLFAGEATDSSHFSTVHGASDSGHREAQRLLSSNKI